MEEGDGVGDGGVEGRQVEGVEGMGRRRDRVGVGGWRSGASQSGVSVKVPHPSPRSRPGPG